MATEFDYVAVHPDGHLVRGRTFAADKDDLIHRLSAEKLFLSSFSRVVTDDGGRVLNETTPPEAAEIPAEPKLFETQSHLKTQHKIFLAGLLAFGVAFGFYRAAHRPTTVDPLLNLNQKIVHIKPGMSRGELEKIFIQRLDGVGSSEQTVYYVAPGFEVIVAYDAQGGPWSALNRRQNKKVEIRVHRRAR